MLHRMAGRKGTWGTGSGGCCSGQAAVVGSGGVSRWAAGACRGGRVRAATLRASLGAATLRASLGAGGGAIVWRTLQLGLLTVTVAFNVLVCVGMCGPRSGQPLPILPLSLT